MVSLFKNKDGQIRSGWIIAGVTLACFLIAFILAIPAGFIVIFVNIIRNDTLNFAEVVGNSVHVMNIVGILLQQGVFLAVPIITWKYVLKRPMVSMGIGRLKDQGKDLLVGLAFGALSMTVVFLILITSGEARISALKPQLSLSHIQSLLLFIAVGFSEEIYGRGFVMSTLRQTKSKVLAVVVSALIFALLHSLNPGIGIIPYLNLFLIGVLFSYMYLLSGNIWMCIGYHITWNYFQGNVFGFLVSGNSTTSLIKTVLERETILNGGAFGPEGGLVVTFIILAGFFFVKYYYRNREYSFIDNAYLSG